MDYPVRGTMRPIDSSMNHGHSLHYFGPFCLDESDHVLLRDGRRVPLPAKAVSTLIVLVRNQGRVVEKNDLMNEVWPNEVVEEGNLAQHIFRLRRAFGETANYIETVPRRGYRFLGKDILAGVPAGQSEDQRRVTSQLTDSPNAHQAYLTGRVCWSRHTREGFEQAIEHFRKAIEFDPAYVLAYAALVDCFLRLATNYLLPEDSLPLTAVAAEVENIEELSAESLAAVKLRCEWDKKTVKRDLRRATELKSSYPAIHQWRAACLFAQGLYLDALSQDGSSPAREVRASEQFQFPGLTLAEAIQVSCLIAREQIVQGNFEAGRLMLQNWYTVGQWPAPEKLSPHSFADLLFAAGKLASNLASTSQVPKAQKHAEALLNGAIGIWEQLGLKRQSAEVQMELGICYWREGLIDLACNSVKTSLKQFDDHDSELRGLGLIRMAIVEMAGCLDDALASLNEAAAFVDQEGPFLSSIHNFELGVVFKHLGVAGGRNDYFERARNLYREALFQFEAIGSYLNIAFTENNYGNLLVTLGQLEEAELHIKRARTLYESRPEKVYLAQFDDTRARFYIATEQFDFAEQILAESIGVLEDSGQEEYVAQSLTTQGMLLCRVGRHRQAKRVLQRAYEIAESGGNRAEAERALLFLIEEMHNLLDDDERRELRTALNRLFASPQQTSPDERRKRCLQLIG